MTCFSRYPPAPSTEFLLHGKPHKGHISSKRLVGVSAGVRHLSHQAALVRELSQELILELVRQVLSEEFHQLSDWLMPSSARGPAWMTPIQGEEYATGSRS
jgi:hypothetical protein